MTTLRWSVLVSLILWTATCGQKGPLQLPAPTTNQASVANHALLVQSIR